MQTVWVAWARTDDFYDDGNIVAVHATEAGARNHADKLVGQVIDNVGTIIETSADEWELLP